MRDPMPTPVQPFIVNARDYESPDYLKGAVMRIEGTLGHRPGVDAEGNPVEGDRIVRVPIEPELYRGPVVLDMRYQITPGRSDSTRLELPPEMRKTGNTSCGSVRNESMNAAPAARLRASGTGCAVS